MRVAKLYVPVLVPIRSCPAAVGAVASPVPPWAIGTEVIEEIRPLWSLINMPAAVKDERVNDPEALILWMSEISPTLLLSLTVNKGSPVVL